MNRRRFSHRMRIQVLGLFMLLGLGAIVMRLWWVQVAQGAGMDGEDPRQLGCDRAHPIGAR